MTVRAWAHSSAFLEEPLACAHHLCSLFLLIPAPRCVSFPVSPAGLCSLSSEALVGCGGKSAQRHSNAACLRAASLIRSLHRWPLWWPPSSSWWRWSYLTCVSVLPLPPFRLAVLDWSLYLYYRWYSAASAWHSLWLWTASLPECIWLRAADHVVRGGLAGDLVPRLQGAHAGSWRRARWELRFWPIWPGKHTFESIFLLHLQPI